MNYNASYQEKTQITNNKTVTEQGKQAVDAYQLNPSKPDTLAYKLEHKLDSLEGAAAHNGIFRGKDITDLYQSGRLWTDIADGSFRNEYIGDYFDLNISTEYTASETIRCLISVFNPYLNCGDTPLTRPHIGITTKNCFAKTHQMNPTNTTANGYNSASIHSVLGKYATAIREAIGEHLIRYRSLLTNSISETGVSMAGAGFTGCSNGWDWNNVQLSLLSEIQVYGSNVFSSSGYDTGIDNVQLPLFALDPAALLCKLGGTDDVNSSNRQWYWLKNVVSTTSFCNVDSRGHSNYGGAGFSGGVRPLFLIG